jgi:hypothetical protein
MKTICLLVLLGCSFTAWAADGSSATYESPPAPPLVPIPAPEATPAPPPSAPAKLSAADLEKLVAPIALYPDPLIATILPASVYPLEIVQAARFVLDTNNLAKLDAQPWDENVKAVARVPGAIKKLNDDLQWTISLGEAFLAQDKDVMDAIQNMRGKAQKAGTLQTSPQQVVTVTNMIVEKTVEQQVVVVTNTVVQIQPSNPQVVYVPTYNPTTVYYPPPAYVYDPVAPLVTFAAGVAVGAIIANNCDWNHGGCYHGGGGEININGDVNINRGNINTGNVNSGNRANASATSQKWQPDQNRLSKSGAPSATSSARSAEARGYGSGGARTSTASAGARPSTATAGARTSTGTTGARPSTGTAAARPSTGASATSRSTASPSASRPSPSASASQSRPSASQSGSAFSGAGNGASARDASSRGASSGSSGGFSGGGGGGARSGGRR